MTKNGSQKKITRAGGRRTRPPELAALLAGRCHPAQPQMAARPARQSLPPCAHAALLARARHPVRLPPRAPAGLRVHASLWAPAGGRHRANPCAPIEGEAPCAYLSTPPRRPPEIPPLLVLALRIEEKEIRER
jgi:hypothetical protein